MIALRADFFVRPLYEPCTPPLRFRAFLYLDLSTGARFDENVPRLVWTLRSGPPRA